MIYEYRCQDCETQFEVWAKMSDPAPESCPDCSSEKLEKIISATNFALKGGGWYSQGYGSSKSNSSNTNNNTKPKNDSKSKES
ncbi:zinc ribbon domain-containing protein [bacterium]|nr:zinc ribbon domain-containing protein [bacterium]